MKQIWVHGAVPALNNQGGFFMLDDAVADALIASGDAHIAGSPFAMPDPGVQTGWKGWQAVQPRELEPPVFTTNPTIVGNTPVGSTLTCGAGVWTGFPEPTIAYQWLQAGVDIVGAIGVSYDTVAGDLGLAISCRVTLTNSSGTDNATSNEITVTA